MNRLAALEREIRGQTICLAIIVGFLVVSSFALLKPVLLPFVLAVFIVMGLNPLLAGIQTRFSTTRLVALAIAAILGFALIFILWSIIWLSVLQLQENREQYGTRFRQLANYTEELLSPIYVMVPGASPRTQEAEPSAESPTDVPQPAARQADNAAPDVEDSEETDAAPDAVAAEDPLEEDLVRNPILPRPPELTAPAETLRNEREPNGSRDAISQIINRGVQIAIYYLSVTLIEIMNSGTMVVIFVFFLLLGSSEAAPRSSDTWQEIDHSVREYIVSKTLISFFTGLAFGFVLWLFGIPLAMVFALLAFLFNFIPNIGPIIASVLPLPLILLDPELSIWGMIAVISLSSAVQIISGNVVEPRMMGDSFDLHPIAILLALLFWGMIWGVIGMFLATPITAVMKIIFSKFLMTRPLADLLAGRLDAVKEKYAEYMGKDPSGNAEPAQATAPRSGAPGPASDLGSTSV